jgi:type I restriction enzyme R subunit
VTSSAISEDALVERPALAWLCDRPGPRWTHVHGADLAPDAPARERKLWSDVVLVERLRAAVARVNPELPPEAVQLVIDRALTSSSPVLIEDHRGFHELLLSGVPVSYIDKEGMEHHERAWLVDFENIANNEFLAINQFTIIDGAKNRRPDILLFVNGLPLGQLELKTPGVVDSAHAAVNQVRHYNSLSALLGGRIGPPSGLAGVGVRAGCCRRWWARRGGSGVVLGVM